MQINIKALREYLVDYYGSAIFAEMPMAIIDTVKVENASDDELIQIAMKEHIDLSEFVLK